jgi:hypothetical protein
VDESTGNQVERSGVSARQWSVDAAVPWLLGAGSLLVYQRTLCPTVYLGDSGEISTAIATGGVIHPPGYPLFSLLARAALVLVPGGEAAFRIGCLVALCASLTVAVLYLVIRTAGASTWAAAAAAAAFGAGYTFWNQSTRVEVYSLHTLLVSLALLLALRYRKDGRLSTVAGLAFVVGLGLSHHLTLMLLGPALLVICGKRLWTDPGLGRRLGVALPFVAIGPLLYLLLLVWARTDPLHAWGRPVTLPLLVTHATARIYRYLLQVPDGPRLVLVLKQSGGLLLDNLPFGLFLLPLVGGSALWRRDRALVSAALLVGAAVLLYNLCYRINDPAPCYLSLWLVLAVLLAFGLDGLAQRTPRHDAWLGLALVAVTGVQLLRNWDSCDLSRATWVREFARHKLASTDRAGVLITQWDPDTFPIWYVQDVLGYRTDVLVVDRKMISGSWHTVSYEPSLWFLHYLRRKGVDAPLSMPRDRAQLEDWVLDGYLIRLIQRQLRDRPLYMTFGESVSPGDRQTFIRWAEAHYEMLPQGVVLALQPKSRPVDLAAVLRKNERAWAGISPPHAPRVRVDQDLDPDYIANHYACMLVNFGGLYELSGNRARAAEIYERAGRTAPHYQPARDALAAARLRTRSRPSGEM